MSDRELLELAAKAAGIKASWGIVTNYGPDGEEQIELTDLFFIEGDAHCAVWNPLTDDGDALRLAMRLASARPGALFAVSISKMHDGRGFAYAGFFSRDNPSSQATEADPNAATRRAIVRAAAEIGRSMP